MRQLIGGLGMALPVLLWLIAGIRPMSELPRWQSLGSVSAYYYTGGTAIFVGVLSALAVFLFTYRGYDNKYNRADRIAGITAGCAAVAVAAFPTGSPAGLVGPSWWRSPVGTVHGIAAVVLFGAFIVFSLALFPKKGTHSHRRKPVRNGVYIICGIGMVACVIWGYLARPVIFWPEALALEFFGVSWLVKGRADWTAGQLLRRAVDYARRPRNLN